MVAEMSPYERVMTAVLLGVPDRIPVVPAAPAFAIRQAGYKFGEVLRDPGKFVHAQVTMRNALGVDALFDLCNSALVGEALGATVCISEDSPPDIDESSTLSYDEIFALEFASIGSKARVPFLLEVIARLKEAGGADVPVFALAAPPFRLAATLLGAENLYMDLIRRPEEVCRLVQKCTPPAIEYALAVIDAGADVVWIPDPMGGATVLSKRFYEKFNLPYLKQVCAAIKGRGGKIVFHACGKWNDRLDLLVDHVDGLHVGAECDLGTLKRDLGSTTSLMGNVKSTDTMLFGTPRDCEDAALACLHQAGQGGGFLLSPDCAVPPATAADNMRALVRASIRTGLSAQ